MNLHLQNYNVCYLYKHKPISIIISPINDWLILVMLFCANLSLTSTYFAPECTSSPLLANLTWAFPLLSTLFEIRSNCRHNTQQPASCLTLKGVQSPKSIWWLRWLQAVSHLSGLWKLLYLTWKKPSEKNKNN